MKFLAMTLIPYAPDPVTGIQPSTTDRLRSVVDNAVLAEELGFDGYGVGERLKSQPDYGETSYQGLDMPAGFMINYHLYRNYWPLLALGRYSQAASSQ